MEIKPDKNSNPIEKPLIQITKFDDLKSIGDLFEKSKDLELNVIKVLFSEKYLTQLHIPGIVALIMLTPLQKAPNHLYDFLSKVIYVKPFLENLAKIPDNYQYCIAMKFAKVACICNKVPEAVQLEVYNHLLGTNPTIYMPSLLYIHAQIKDPFTCPIQYRKDGRIDTITLYYLSLNHMLKDEFREAEFLLRKCYLLSKSCKDIRPSIIHKLSLASFLNRTPRDVFKLYIPEKHFPKGIAGDIWEPRLINTSQLDGFYQEFESKIVKESARRIILDYAETTSAISTKDLCKACGVKQNDLNKILDELAASGDLKFDKSADGVITFIALCCVKPVNDELLITSQLLSSIKGQ